MIAVSSKLEDVKAPNGRYVKDIVNDVNTEGPTEEQVKELLDSMEFLIDRLVHTDSERFN